MAEPTAVTAGGSADRSAGGAADPVDQAPRDQVPLAQVPVHQVPGDQAPVRRPGVIGNDSTIEIPVHLLFREDSPDAIRQPPGQHAAPAGVTGAHPVDGSKRQARTASRLPASDRPSPGAGPRLAERPGPSLPGAVAVFGGAVALALLAGLLWRSGLVPDRLAVAVGLEPQPFDDLRPVTEVAITVLALLAAFAYLGLGRGQAGHVQVLSRHGDYRGSVRRAGLLWTSPLLLRRPLDVRLRHWRSEPMQAADAEGTALRVVVLMVWRVMDTAKAAHAVADHEAYLAEQVEAAVARVFSQLPADAFDGETPTLRDTEAVGDALTRMLRADAAPVGVEVCSAQPSRLDYAPEVAGAMQRRRIAAVDARHREAVLTSVVDAVEDTVARLTARGLVDLDADQRNALVKDLTIAFYAGRF